MARNYCDIPILVVKLKAKSAITAGQLLKGGDTGGWANADGATTTTGFYSLGPAAAYDSGTAGNAGWVRAMAIGTFRASCADSIQAGMGVIYSDSQGKIDSCSDSFFKQCGTLIDPNSDSAGTTRANRVLITGIGTPNAKWDTI